MAVQNTPSAMLCIPSGGKRFPRFHHKLLNQPPLNQPPQQQSATTATTTTIGHYSHHCINQPPQKKGPQIPLKPLMQVLCCYPLLVMHVSFFI